MVNLTRIYTRTGDDGSTALGDFSRVSKTDSRLAAYADVDEANSSIGVVLAGPVPAAFQEVLLTIQNDLFDVGADLCTPLRSGVDEDGQRSHEPPSELRVTADYVTWLESQCDRFNTSLEPLRSFVLPGGTPAAAGLHVARTVTRRAERSAWAAWHEHSPHMSPVPATYLNRLSDLLFIMARFANHPEGSPTPTHPSGTALHGDVLWQPGRRQQPT